MKKVMVFGVFDGLHEGHRRFLRQAKSLGDYLIVAVAQNQVVEDLKGHQPRQDLAERFVHLEAEDQVDKMVVGDAVSGTWGIVRSEKPDVIAIGYDQETLKTELESHISEFEPVPDIIVLEAYEPNIYKSSLLNDG